MSNEQAIGVFDSGIGGMTVVRALLQELPHENIVYFGDTARVPYGPKSPQVVREYALQDTEILLQHNVKMIVVACNTVSAVALDVVQKRAKIPVIGVILPGAEAAVQISRKKRIGVIGTVGTIASNAYTTAIHHIDASVKVFGQPCPLFVPLAEEGWIDHKATELIAKEYLFPLTLEKIDTLVLGCTHYPFVIPLIQEIAGPGVRVIDPAPAVARQAARLLQAASLESGPQDAPGRVRYYTSANPHALQDLLPDLLGCSLEQLW